MSATRTPGHRQSGWFMILILGLLTGFDALAIDMYLPAISVIAGDLGVMPADVQSSLSVFLVGLALGQFLMGPIADRFGRRATLIGGVALFLAATFAIVQVTGLTGFLTARFLQGLGGAAGVVIPRMVVSEMFDRRRAARVFATLMQIMMIAPVAAPPLGGLLLDALGWRSIFWTIGIVGTLSLLGAIRAVPETLPPAKRRPLRLGSTAAGYLALLRDPVFALATLAGSLIISGLFVYIGASAFLFIEHFGLSPQAYSLIFAGASLSLVLAGRINNMLLDRVGEERLLTFGLTAYVASVSALVLLFAVAPAALVPGALLIVASMSSLSFAVGNITAIALDRPGEQSGLASSLFGTAQYAFAGVIGTVAAALQHDNALVPPVAMMACGLSALIAWRLSRALSRSGHGALRGAS